MSSSRLVRIGFGAILVALVAASLLTYWMMERRREAFEGLSPYNLAYSASQTVMEFERFEQALLELHRSRTPAALDEAKLRFDILSNRVGTITRGELAEFIQAEPKQERVVASLADAVRSIGPVLDRADVALDVAPVLATLRPLDPQMIGLATGANFYRVTRIAEYRRGLLRLQQQFSMLTFGLIFCSLGLVGVLTWHNRLLARAHRTLSLTTSDLEQSANDLAAANRAVASANEELIQQNGRLIEKEDALRAQNALFDAALNNMSQGLCMFDDDLRPIVRNRQFEKMFEIAGAKDSAAETSQWPLRDLIPDFARKLGENIKLNRKTSFETECSDGRIIAVAQQPMPDGGWVATFADVTRQRKAQAHMAHMASHDVLTDLPNRYAFRERIREALRDCEASSGMLTVMCLDLDNFKEVNDTLGHPTGDALLCAAAQRLRRTIRETDMVARFGGDEFAILQPRIERLDDAERLAARLIEEMRRPYLINGETIYATASIGIAVSPKHGSDPDALQKNADLALYAAKADGKRTYRLFKSVMDERLSSRHGLERDLRLAVAANEFELHYQPIVQLKSGKMTGLEALLRWRHPVHGIVSPTRFIPVAEETGLINDIGRWVLAQACADAARWPSHLKVSVNLSVAQFTQGDIVEDIRGALSRAGLRPERLVAEITESLLLSENGDTLETLQRLKALRIDIAMDDFGTGYSSLSYLNKYSFDRIKIDRDFISGPNKSEKTPAVIEAIVQLGSALGMTTVAEGIETEGELAMLIAAGCEEGQGYLFSRPVPREKLFEIIDGDLSRQIKVA